VGGLEFGVEVWGKGTQWWSAVGGYLRYSEQIHRLAISVAGGHDCAATRHLRDQRVSEVKL
jgi:hypothetical protein